MHEENGDERMVCRRWLLRQAALLAGATGLWAGAASKATGAEKMSQKDAEYQPTPKNGQTCRTCEQFTAPAGCKIVVGKISPQGWCQFVAEKTTR
jgi:High potential iron-sulfur protein